MAHAMTRRARRGLGRWLARGGDAGSARYDYGEIWPAFTGRLARLGDADEVSRELADVVMQASGAVSVAVYLAEAGDLTYRLSAGFGSTTFAPRIEQTSAMADAIRKAATATPMAAESLVDVTTPPLPGAFGVPIRWRATLPGLLVLGPRESGLDYGDDDRRFLVAVSEQVALALAAMRGSEAVPEPRRLETLDRFTAVAMHDLKNAVSALSLLARNATHNFADPEFQRDATITLSRTVARMSRLLARLASSDVTPPPATTEAIDLQALIIEATSPLAADAKVRLVRELSPVNTVYGDRDALLRVVENLTTNAAEAIDREGTVTVTLAEEQGHAVISVADTGCGIPVEYQQHHLFSPFRSTKQGGWGIGLYQTKQVVENQDGEIRVESVEGHGTTFTVKLPLRADVDSHSLETVR